MLWWDTLYNSVRVRDGDEGHDDTDDDDDVAGDDGSCRENYNRHIRLIPGMWTMWNSDNMIQHPDTVFQNTDSLHKDILLH